MKITLSILFILSTLLLIFTLQNNEAISLRFLLWNLNLVPTWYMIISGLLGVVAGIFIVFPFIQSKNRKIDELNSFIDDFRIKEREVIEERELNDLKIEK